MSAFVVATPKIKDKDKFGEYSKAAGETLAAYGATVAKRGAFAASLVGGADHTAVVVIEFSDSNTIKEWYNSDAYQAIIPLRDEACDMTITSYEVSA